MEKVGGFQMAEEKLEKLRLLHDQVQAKACSVLKFTLQWKELNEYLGAMKIGLVEQAKTVALGEKQLEVRETELRRWHEEVEMESKRVDEKVREFEVMRREKDLLEKQIAECKMELSSKGRELEWCREEINECSREIGGKKMELMSVRKELAECSGELNAKGEQLAEVQKLLEGSKKELESKERQLVSADTLLDESKKSLGLYTKELEEKNENLARIQLLVKACEVELESKERDYKSKLESKEKQLGTLQKVLDNCSRDVGSKVQELDSVQKSLNLCLQKLESRKQELHGMEDLIRQRAKELNSKERELDGVQESLEKRSKALEGEVCRLDSIKELIQEHNEELQKKEKQYENMTGLIERASAKLALAEKELSTIHASIKESLRHLELKKGHLNSITTEIHEKAGQLKEMEERCSEAQQSLDNLSLIKSRQADMKSIENTMNKLLAMLELEENRASTKLALAEKKLSTMHASIKESLRHLELKKDHLNSVTIELQEKTVQLKEREKRCSDAQQSLDYLVSLIKSREADLKSIENSTNKLLARLKLEEKRLQMLENAPQLPSGQVKTKQIEATQDCNAFNSASANIQSTVATDVRSLVSIISDSLHNVGSMKSEVSKVLLDLRDPAEQVLDLLNDVGFSANEVRARFLFMEQLVRISPRVSPKVKEASIPLAVRWKSCVTLGDENPMEVLAFLLFLFVYGVASFFSETDILELVMMIAQHKQAPEICRNLGFTDRMPDFIRVLIQKKKHMEAARFICSFGLTSEFPIEPLLKRYLENRRMEAWISKYEINAPEDVDWFLDRELDALRAISIFILEFKLDLGSVLQCINDGILQLKIERAGRRLPAPTPVQSISHHAQEMNYHPGGTSSSQANAPRIQPYPLPQHHKRPRMVAHTDGRFVSQASNQANVYSGASYFYPGSGTSANYRQSSECVITSDNIYPSNGNLRASQFHEPSRRHPHHFQ